MLSLIMQEPIDVLNVNHVPYIKVLLYICIISVERNSFIDLSLYEAFKINLIINDSKRNLFNFTYNKLN